MRVTVRWDLQWTCSKTQDWSWGLIRTRLSFPLSQSLPSGSFHKPLILLPKRENVYRQTENHRHRKLTNLITWTTALSNYNPCLVGPPKMDRSWWRVLTKCGPLEKGMANHFSILSLRTPWTVWKDKNIGELPRSVGAQYPTGDQWRNNSRKNGDGAKSKTTPSCGCDWLWK